MSKPNKQSRKALHKTNELKKQTPFIWAKQFQSIKARYEYSGGSGGQ